ncbi:MAG: CocE/NonD family hydrolase C-terminal non-catalytic domain-containing protein, partial [Promethearchaeota archaeon]
LTYTSPPLKEDMEITGHPIIALYLSVKDAQNYHFFKSNINIYVN